MCIRASPVCAPIPGSQRSSSRSDYSNTKSLLSFRAPPDSRGIDDGLADSINSQGLFNARVGQRGGAEWGQTQPRGDEAERLAQVPGVELDHAVSAGGRILPLFP